MSTITNLLMLFTCFFQTNNASTVSFDAFPKDIIENITTSVSMICRVEDNVQTRAASSSFDVRHISSIFISRRDGDDVASVTAFDPPTALADLDNIDVKGSVSGLSGEGSLELSWKDPFNITIGEYMCTMHAVDTKGHHVVLNSKLTMTSVTPTVMDLVGLINNVNLKVLKLQQKDEDQQQEIIQLRTQLQACSQSVVFKAVLKHNFSIATGQTVVFDNTMLNEGGGYNNTTGRFECKLPGTYAFNVYAQTAAGAEVIALGIQLDHKGVSSVWAGNDRHEHSSIGAVIALETGDVVEVIAWSDSKLFPLGNGGANSFSGFLLHADACKT